MKIQMEDQKYFTGKTGEHPVLISIVLIVNLNCYPGLLDVSTMFHTWGGFWLNLRLPGTELYFQSVKRGGF